MSKGPGDEVVCVLLSKSLPIKFCCHTISQNISSIFFYLFLFSVLAHHSIALEFQASEIFYTDGKHIVCE